MHNEDKIVNEITPSGCGLFIFMNIFYLGTILKYNKLIIPLIELKNI